MKRKGWYIYDQRNDSFGIMSSEMPTNRRIRYFDNKKESQSYYDTWYDMSFYVVDYYFKPTWYIL